MSNSLNCSKCGEYVGTIAIVDLVYVWKPCTDGELHEFAYHRKCFVDEYLAQQGTQQPDHDSAEQGNRED